MSQSHNGLERLVNEQGLVDVWFFVSTCDELCRD